MILDITPTLTELCHTGREREREGERERKRKREKLTTAITLSYC